MILSRDDKYKFNNAMQFFTKLLQNDIRQINSSVDLKLLSFGIPIESHNDILYFDFPYNEENGDKVDEINRSLKQGERFDDVDTKMYALLESLNEKVKFIAYNYEEIDGQLHLSSEFKTKLSSAIVSSNYNLIKDFFPIMFFSAFPEKWAGVNSVDEIIKVVGNKKFTKWFIIIHNENISDSSNTIISNYCLMLNSDIPHDFEDQLLLISNKLQDFSRYYGTKDFNVIIRKNVEYSDMVLSLNYELFHHVKELHSNFTMEPIREYQRKNECTDEVSLIFRNTGRIQEFYENYMELVKANFVGQVTLHMNAFFETPDFTGFMEDIKKQNPGFSIEMDGIFEGSILCLPPCFNIIIREIILNAIKAFRIQKIDNKQIRLSCNYLPNNQYLEFTIISIGTEFICEEEDNLGIVPVQSNFERSQSGVGLFLINNLLKKMSAYCYNDDKQLYFCKREEYNSLSGVAIQFALPVS